MLTFVLITTYRSRKFRTHFANLNYRLILLAFQSFTTCRLCQKFYTNMFGGLPILREISSHTIIANVHACMSFNLTAYQQDQLVYQLASTALAKLPAHKSTKRLVLTFHCSVQPASPFYTNTVVSSLLFGVYCLDLLYY